jgi:RND family efflux transporter MFP subunit
MRIISQLALVLVLGAVAVPLAARFVPGTHPWLAKAGLLAPLQEAGLVLAAPAEAGGGSAGNAGGGQKGGSATPVMAAEPVREVLRDVVTAIGSARGVQSVVVSPEVAGRVTALRATPGQEVKAGDVIAELDAEQAELALERAKLVYEDAQATLTRLERLAGSGATTDLQRQEAELARRTAELALATAERDLADHRLVAPIAGFVGLIEVQVGDLVTSATVVTRIEDRSSLIVDFRVPERVATLVRPGDPLTAAPVSSPGTVLDGRITAVDNRVDETSRSLRVQAQIGNEGDRLRAGMAFRIALEFTGADYPAVDPLAIQWRAEGAYVWIVRAGKAARLPIRILQRNAKAVLVEAALEQGDLVVTEGVQALRPGAAVEVTGSERVEG